MQEALQTMGSPQQAIEIIIKQIAKSDMEKVQEVSCWFHHTAVDVVL